MDWCSPVETHVKRRFRETEKKLPQWALLELIGRDCQFLLFIIQAGTSTCRRCVLYRVRLICLSLFRRSRHSWRLLGEIQMMIWGKSPYMIPQNRKLLSSFVRFVSKTGLSQKFSIVAFQTSRVNHDIIMDTLRDKGISFRRWTLSTIRNRPVSPEHIVDVFWSFSVATIIYPSWTRIFKSIVMHWIHGAR